MMEHNMITIQTFLSHAKKHVSDAKLIVIGNEAADLDSIASSIVYAYLRNLQGQRSFVLPLMVIPRKDFMLRTEAVYVFKEANIDLDDVVFIDELDLDKTMEQAEIALVDHNKLAGDLKKFDSRVVSILDHHRDEELYKTASPRIIEPVGSTTSLVAREFFTSEVDMSRDVAVLLGGTILLDTVNLADDAGRVTQLDKEIAARVLPLCPLSQQEFFDTVQKEKFNVAGLSTNDLLRKDYKEWQFGTMKCGIGSALLPLEQWAEIDNDLATGFAKFAAGRNLDLLLSMNAYTNPEFNRDLVIFCKSKDAHDQLLAYLQENKLDLTPIDCPGQKQGDNWFITFYKQGNLGMARKKLQPLLTDFYK
jgi:exopolyphosphatase